jgi:hypothetical protein
MTIAVENDGEITINPATSTLDLVVTNTVSHATPGVVVTVTVPAGLVFASSGKVDSFTLDSGDWSCDVSNDLTVATCSAGTFVKNVVRPMSLPVTIVSALSTGAVTGVTVSTSHAEPATAAIPTRIES